MTRRQYGFIPFPVSGVKQPRSVHFSVDLFGS